MVTITVLSIAWVSFVKMIKHEEDQISQIKRALDFDELGVIKMKVVKEPQEASDAVKAYPPIQWNTLGLPPLRVALVTCVVVTAVGGILSNPLFQWASDAVAGTPILQQAIAAASGATLG